MAQDRSKADGGQARPGRVHPAAGPTSLVTRLAPGRLAALALALLCGTAGAAPADLPPWDPAGNGTAAEPATRPTDGPSRGAVTGSSSPTTPPDGPSTVTGPSPGSPSITGPATPSSPRSAGAPAAGASAHTPARASDELPPPPRDPNDAPFMRPPNNQVQGLPPRTRPDIRRGWSARRRFAVTVAPAFAQLRLPFSGGRPARLPGAGLNLELDVQVWRWVWLRAHGTYSGHPVDEVRMQNSDMEIVQTAPRGTIHATGFGGGPVFALDLGRFLPLIEVGLGGMRVVTPRGGNKGQRGEACGDGGACDVGLKCSAATNTCEPTVLPDLYFGAAVDLLVRRNFSLGAQFRYYSRLKRGEIANFPVYLLGTIRFAVRF